MDYIDLLHNLALLVTLAAVYQVVISHLIPRATGSQTLLGILFGLAAVLAMMAPVNFRPGIIFDGRSIILAVGSLIGGPLVAAISSAIAGAYRIWLGGGGAPVGVSVIVSASAIGTLFYYLRRRIGGYYTPLQLLGFGLLVHLVMLGLFQFLPGDAGAMVTHELWVMFVVFYPIVTMLISLLFQDYERQQVARSELNRLAHYDTLSGLPNRMLLTERLDLVLERCLQASCHGALLFFNIDRFKTLNDARGHAIGDALLRAVSARLQPLLGPQDVLARMAADEFAVLLDGGELTSAEVIASRASDLESLIHVALKQPLHVGSDEISVTVSIGIALFPQGETDTHGEVMRRADNALHRAKQEGGNRSVVFEHSMAHRVEEHYQIERELRRAIGEGELRLYLQSQVNADGAIVGAEALVRWQHPRRGLVAPGLFIPIAEESDLIIDLGMWVFREACAIIGRSDVTRGAFRLAVNISPRHFRQPSFVAFVREALQDAGVDPHHLTLEITESLLIDNVVDVVAKMTELTALGIRFSIDDFGTGYSSLTYLKRLPIHEIKIDKAFVQGAPTYVADANLVETILAVAAGMKLDVVAEGVETAEQAAFLKQRAKVIYQGYLFARPVPTAEWLSHWHENGQV